MDPLLCFPTELPAEVPLALQNAGLGHQSVTGPDDLAAPGPDGRTTGYMLSGRKDVAENVKQAIAPVALLDATQLTFDAFIGTDNWDFLLEGIPTLVANQDEADYEANYHSAADTYDKVNLERVKRNGAAAAITVFGLADSPKRIGPRQSRAEIEELIKFLTGLKVDGMLVTPGYHYQVLGNDEIYLTKDEMPYKFKRVQKLADSYKIINTPIYLDYLAGDRDLSCSPWTTVTRNPRGWKGPCYLITNGHYKTFEELHAATDWEYYRTKQDIRCRDCKLHSGFEGTVALEFGKNLKDSWRMVRHYVA